MWMVHIRALLLTFFSARCAASEAGIVDIAAAALLDHAQEKTDYIDDDVQLNRILLQNGTSD
jgi:DNA gyrase/topoisomerase IV subunit B